jgi:purine-binding chemotaxis protein CheW
MHKSETKSTVEFISLNAGGQGFCIEIKSIREIRRWNSVTPLPNSPTSVLGVMNLRGAVIPIVDLSARLGLSQATVGARSVVVVAAIGNRVMGLLVEAVSEILSVSAEAIQPNPTQGSDSSTNQITGLLSIEDTMLRVLNLDDLFTGTSEAETA